MTRHINPDLARITDPYKLFAAMLDLVGDEEVAVIAQSAGQLHPARLENIARDRLRLRQNARYEAAIKASAQAAA